ncbi:MAG: hypothetical protein H7A37_02800 [Chlamydiales bacterium]|nr:hypothetical protein [Chlamydiia bacterium]MCP5507216.1 hypothetical protein [Chlamydiales bacterium]
MKKIMSLLLSSLAMTMAVNGSLAADENIPVGTRQMEWTDEMRTQEEIVQKEREEIEEDEMVAAGNYYSSHEGAYYSPIAVSSNGGSVTLHDGSCWTIRSWDSHKTLDWLTSDTIVILPNWPHWSTYQFKLHNVQTGKTCEANLTLGPVYNGACTHWIVAIDYTWSEIILEDGSRWKISIFDDSTLKKWLINDTVMIGNNDSFMRPNILINVNMLNYVEAECTN